MLDCLVATAFIRDEYDEWHKAKGLFAACDLLFLPHMPRLLLHCFFPADKAATGRYIHLARACVARISIIRHTNGPVRCSSFYATGRLAAPVEAKATVNAVMMCCLPSIR